MNTLLEALHQRDSLLWRKGLIIFLFSVSLPVSSAFPWGCEGHEHINRNAALKAASSFGDFPSFFQSRRSIQIITYNGPEPDRWKRSPDYRRRNGHSLAHYISLDSFQDFPRANDHLSAIQLYQERDLDWRAVG